MTLAGAGFNQNDMVQMFGEGMFEHREADLVQFSEYISGIFDKYNKVSDINEKKSQSENYLVFVFPTAGAIDALIEQEQWPENRYQNGVALLVKFGLPTPAPTKL